MPIDWDNLSDKEEKRILREISKLKDLSPKELEEERKLAETKGNEVKIELIADQQKLREMKDALWKEIEKEGKKEETKKEKKERAKKGPRGWRSFRGKKVKPRGWKKK